MYIPLAHNKAGNTYLHGKLRLILYLDACQKLGLKGRRVLCTEEKTRHVFVKSSSVATHLPCLFAALTFSFFSGITFKELLDFSVFMFMTRIMKTAQKAVLYITPKFPVSTWHQHSTFVTRNEACTGPLSQLHAHPEFHGLPTAYCCYIKVLARTAHCICCVDFFGFHLTDSFSVVPWF